MARFLDDVLVQQQCGDGGERGGGGEDLGSREESVLPPKVLCDANRGKLDASVAVKRITRHGGR